MSGAEGAGVRTRFQKPPGESFVAIATQVGHTRGIEIDNPCGSWLYIPSLEQSIPPYTTGWAFGFPYDVAAVDVLSRDRVPSGPAGQISTLQGDPVVVYLTDLELMRREGVASGNASGSPTSDQNFIRAFTPILAANTGIVSAISSVGQVFPLIAAIPNKRFRVYTFYVDRADNLGGVFRAIMQDTTLKQFASLRLGMNEPRAESVFTQGLDFPVGEPVNILTTALLLTPDSLCNVFTTYSVI